MSLSEEEMRELTILLAAGADKTDHDRRLNWHRKRVSFNPKQRKIPARRPKLRILQGLPLKQLPRDSFIDLMTTENPSWDHRSACTEERRERLMDQIFKRWREEFLPAHCDCSPKQVARLGHNCATRYAQFDWDEVLDAIIAANIERERRRPWFLRLAAVDGVRTQA